MHSALESATGGLAVAAVESAGSISVQQIKPVLDALQGMGFSVEPMLAACGLQRAMFDSPFARFPVQREFELWAAIERHTGDPHIGLRVGQSFVRRGPHQLDAYLVVNSGTLRRALRNLEVLVRLADDRGHIDLSEDAAVATLSLRRSGGHLRPAAWVDTLFAHGTTLLFDRIPGFHLLGVELRRARPATFAAYREAFGVVPSFGAAQNAISFDRGFLDVPLRGSDTALGDVLVHLTAQLVQHVPYVDPLLARVQSLLSDGLSVGGVGLANVARATGTSPRTLRRRLAELGTSFQAVLDGLRRERASHYLRHGSDSIEAIAAKLGFAGTGAFQRAFQRWHGVSPSAYRAAHRPVVRADDALTRRGA